MEPLSKLGQKPFLESQQTQKKSTSSNPTDNLVSESTKNKFHEQQLQGYRERHIENIRQQKQKGLQGLEKLLTLGRQEDFKKAIEETNQFLSVPKSCKEQRTYIQARLVYAVGTGNIELLKICCNATGVFDVINQNKIPGFPEGFTPLMLAASRPMGEEGSVEILKILLSNLADTNAVDSQGMMALDYLEDGLVLSQKPFEECRSLLIKKGSIDCHTTPELYEKAHEEWKGWRLRHQGETLEGASGCENVEKAAVYKWVFNNILAVKKISNHEHDAHSELTFQEAAQIIGSCIKSWQWTSRDINNQLKQGEDFIEKHLIRSLIIQAGKCDNWSLIKRLLEAGIDRNNNAFIELFECLGDPPCEIVKYFAERCDITKRDGSGNTALMRAISKNMSLHEEELEHQIIKGDYDASIYDGGSHESNNLEVIRFLLAAFKERQPSLINASNTSGETAFTLAKQSYSRDIGRYFSELEKSTTNNPAQEII